MHSFRDRLCLRASLRLIQPMSFTQLKAVSQFKTSQLAALLSLGLLFSATVLLSGCGGTSVPAPPTGITINGPASDTIDPGDSANFTATVQGGASAAGVHWTLTGCSASNCGGLFDATSTAVTFAVPVSVSTGFTVTLTATSAVDSSVTASVTLTVPADLSIAPASGALPGAVFQSAYTQTLRGSGGIPPYTWSVSQGVLPAGLTLSSSGVIGGLPIAVGAASFTVKLTDSGSPALTTSASYTLSTVYPPLAITTTALPNGVEGSAYNYSLMAQGGSGVGYVWTVTSGSALSAVGLTLLPSGQIAGAPNANETSVPLTVQVTDSAGNTASATLALTVTAVAFQGQVLSGSTPVANATIQLYAVGASGNGSSATPMLSQAVTSDDIGMFQLNGLYTCGKSSSGAGISGSNQIYLVASGGMATLNSSQPPSGSNASLIMVAALGPCSNLTPTSFFTINEVTTAAAAWALAPFATSATSIGATSTNSLGISNAFLDAALLANPSTGGPATLPSGLHVETGKLNALADAINSCTGGDGSSCTPLFTAATPPTGGATPQDAFTAALNIVHHPGENVSAVWALLPSTPPFATSPLSQSPNDWTMSLTVTGGGLSLPTALGIDSQNNIWVANQNGPLSAFNAQGTPLSSTGYGLSNGISDINEVYGLAIDPSNNIWVTNANGNGGGGAGSVTEFYGVTNPSTQGSYASYSDYSLQYPYAIAANNTVGSANYGDLYIANSGTSSVTVYNSSGTPVATSLGANYDLADVPNAIALDSSGGFWLSGNDDVAHISSTGTLLVDAACCGESYGIATDAAGDLWIADYLGGSNYQGAVAEAVTTSSGSTSVPITGLATGGIDHPAMVAVDAAQNVWISNFHGDSITELAGATNSLPVGTAISPTTGTYGTGGYGLDASLGEPFSLLPDRSGNLWVSNEGAPTLTMFFGLAAPTVTPLQSIPTAP
ncbi:MAG: putative Ig domain-containing protein [Acidobacteriaceae bacterium]